MDRLEPCTGGGCDVSYCAIQEHLRTDERMWNRASTGPTNVNA